MEMIDYLNDKQIAHQLLLNNSIITVQLACVCVFTCGVLNSGYAIAPTYNFFFPMSLWLRTISPLSRCLRTRAHPLHRVSAHEVVRWHLRVCPLSVIHDICATAHTLYYIPPCPCHMLTRGRVLCYTEKSCCARTETCLVAAVAGCWTTHRGMCIHTVHLSRTHTYRVVLTPGLRVCECGNFSVP